MTELIIFLVAAAATAAICVAIGRKQRQAAVVQAAERVRLEEANGRALLEERIRGAQQREESLQQELATATRATAALQEENSDLRTQIATGATRFANLEERLKEQAALHQQAEERLSQAFKNLAADALKTNNESFLNLARTALERFQEGAQGDLSKRQQAIEQLVAPIRESLSTFDTKIKNLEKDRVDAYSGLREQVRGLGETQLRLQEETANLVKALRAPQVRGRWGEMQLRRTVELAGMINHVDFVEQESTATEEGRLRPDMVIRLPNERRIVVDAKAPLAAYLEALEEKEPDKQRLLLQQHARQIRTHLQQLGTKNYWKQYDPSPEFVVLFLPGETFFSAALEQDPELVDFGVSEKVILATPTTLIALLKAVAFGWRQEKIALEAQEISELGRDLHDRIATWAGHLGGMGTGLGRAVDSYNKAVGSLERMVLPQARRFKELHLNTGNTINPLDSVDKTPREPASLETSATTDTPD